MISRSDARDHARHEHHGHQTAYGGDEGIAAADMRPPAIVEPPTTAAIRISRAYSRKSRQTRENDYAWPPSRGRDPSIFLSGRFHTA